MDTATQEVEELPPSKLGTKGYWDDVYNKELDISDDEDPGWFGASASSRVFRWLLRNKDISKSASILDIGCGAGYMVAELFEKGFTNIVGIDYSQPALQVCKKALQKRGIETDSVSWVCVDIMSQTLIADRSENLNPALSKLNVRTCSDSDTAEITSDSILCKFDICIDKGTYDAVSLNPDDSHEKRQLYIKKLCSWMSNNGLFIIVSCNWTVKELVAQFSCLKFIEEIKASSFSFGGSTGQTVSTCIFTKKNL